MARSIIPVDFTNPGQVFACHGFIEAAEILQGKSQGCFCWDEPGQTHFIIEAAGKEEPVERVLRFLLEAEVLVLTPGDQPIEVEGVEVPAQQLDGTFFPMLVRKPPTLPARLRDNAGNVIDVHHWGDATYRRDNLKFWAGMGGLPGANILKKTLDLVKAHDVESLKSDPFSFSSRLSSSFRFDWRRDYVPLDAGFSPNEHKSYMEMVGFPIVEIMAAIGLSDARPRRESKLAYTYSVVGGHSGVLYNPQILRPSLGATKPLFGAMKMRTYRMTLDWPGQKDQARCITKSEEIS